MNLFFGVIKLNKYMYKSKFTFHKQWFFGLEMQRRQIKTKICFKYFYSIKKETTHKHSNVASAKNYFFKVQAIGTTLFAERFFFFNLITGSHYFHKSLSLRAFPTAILLLQFKQLFKISPYFTLIPRQQCKGKSKFQNEAFTYGPC